MRVVGSHPPRGPLVGAGYESGGVHRNNGADILEDVAAKTGIGLEFEKAAWPQAHLLSVEMQCIIHIAPGSAAGAAAARYIRLRRQQQIDIEHDSLLGE